jgi:hypothetical protein
MGRGGVDVGVAVGGRKGDWDEIVVGEVRIMFVLY